MSWACSIGGAEVSVEPAAGQPVTAAQLDHDRASEPRHVARELPQLGLGSRHGDRTECRANWCTCVVELQGLWRLPRSNAIIFGIRCYLISVQELAHHSQMGAARTTACSRTCIPRWSTTRGLTRYRDAVVEWLAPFDDGAPTTPATEPE